MYVVRGDGALKVDEPTMRGGYGVALVGLGLHEQPPLVHILLNACYKLQSLLYHDYVALNTSSSGSARMY